MFSINYSSTSTEDLDSFFITRADSSSSSSSETTPTTVVVTASHTVYITPQQTETDADAETDVGAKPPATTSTPSNSPKAAKEVAALLRLVSGSAQKM